HTVNASGKSPTQLSAEVVAQFSEECPDGVAVSVDALGREDTIAAGIASLAPLGRHVQIGLLSAPPVIDVGRVIGLELSVLGSHGMAAAEYPEMLDLVGDGRLRPQDLVTNVIGLEDAPAAMEMLGSSTGSGMTIIDLSR
ncbi:MAG: zinc-binding dehydrogenase, partial [Brevibacterium aurantiacum]